jgi:hypothetical protein
MEHLKVDSIREEFQMIRSTLFWWVLLAIALPATAQDAKGLGSLDFDLDRLKTWGTKTYIYELSRPGSSERTILGRVTLKTEVTGDLVILNDQAKISYRGTKQSLDLTHRCKKDNFLSPIRIDSKSKGEVGTFVATIDGEKATIRSEGRERTMVLPRNVVTTWAFYRLVTLMPRQKGSRISYPYSIESEDFILVERDFLVECMGRGTVQSGQERITCTKFCLNGRDFYWVGDDGVLRQVLTGGGKLWRLRDNSDEDE